MAKAFIYDSIDLLECTIDDGVYAPGGPPTFTIAAPLGSKITNRERLIDQSIGLACSDIILNDCFRMSFDSAVAVSAIALYFSVAETDDLEILYGTIPGEISGTALSMTATFAIGWNVFTFTEATKQYWFLRSSTGGIDNLREMVLGKKYDFEQQLLQGGIIGDDPGVNVLTSHGGIEFANKKHDPKTRWAERWGGLSASEKTNLESFRDDVGINYKKFLFYDETNYHWVRMTPDSLRFTNEAGKVSYSAPITLIEQLQ